ncbi:MAG: hypothetical protein KF760_25525 [Candidatus Eremiobacteraeota bacterium]|nr:hypothetical protein [Candidatus Eremiobacteraeota bacterium]MCW5866838.1 hypothetical protein [Candidatus Eremiobacteraeota bacterium]
MSTAETVARLKRPEDRMGELKVDQVDMRLALETQAKAQETAMDQLLELVADHEERLADRMERLEERMARLEKERPPAA